MVSTGRTTQAQGYGPGLVGPVLVGFQVSLLRSEQGCADNVRRGNIVTFGVDAITVPDCPLRRASAYINEAIRLGVPLCYWLTRSVRNSAEVVVLATPEQQNPQ